MASKNQFRTPRAKRKGRGVIVTATHAPGLSSAAGAEERKDLYARRAMQLKRDGKTLQEIAEEITKEFQLTRQPHFTTVAYWIRKAQDEIVGDLKELTQQLRFEQFEQTARMLALYMKIATDGEMKIRRKKIEDGETVYVEDEDTFAERVKAADICIKLMARQAKLMGLDVPDGISDKTSAGLSFTEFQVWLSGHMGTPKPAEQGGENGQPSRVASVFDKAMEVLEIDAGIEDTRPDWGSDSV